MYGNIAYNIGICLSSALFEPGSIDVSVRAARPGFRPKLLPAGRLPSDAALASFLLHCTQGEVSSQVSQQGVVHVEDG